MRLPSLVILAAAVAFAALNLGSTLARSTIPYAIHGEVIGIDVRFEKNPGVDDVYLVAVDRRVLHVDRAVGVRLRRGDRVDKAAWSRTVRTERGTVLVRPSAEFRRMVAVMPLVVLGAVALVLGGIDRRAVRV